MDVRPKVLLSYGREQQLIQVPLFDLLYGMPATSLSIDLPVGSDSSTIFDSLLNRDALSDAISFSFLYIGTPGGETSEIFNNSLSTTLFPHSASTPVYLCLYDQIELSQGAAIDSMGQNIITTSDIIAASQQTSFHDTTYTNGYYFARFYDSRDTVYSPYSDPVPVAQSYSLTSARAIIDAALGEINKTTSEVLSDSFAFQQLDAFQTDVLKELKRWSFMQEFDAAFGQFNVGEWRLKLPDGVTVTNGFDGEILPVIDDPDTNKSIYNIRVGANGRLTWIDKAKWDDFIFNLAYSPLAVNLIAGATSMVLKDSSDFNHLTGTNTDGSGTVIIGGNTYTYSANTIATNTLTLSTVITSANIATAGQYVFQNANQGLPDYYTIFGGYIWYWPITSAEYDGLNAFMDYYVGQARILRDSDEIVVPDPLAASYFLQWKFLKKMNNGDEDEGSLACMNNYLARREKLKNKDVKNRVFKMSPRYQNFAIQEQWSSGDPRYVRDGNFPNTGF